MSCYCGNETSFEECCEPFLNGEKKAGSAEVLMRSRYSAYVSKNAEYLNKTSTANVPEVVFTALDALVWLQLKVEHSSENEVTFCAYFKEGESIEVMKEHSYFIEEQGRLKYDRGEMLEARIQRNEICPCGSGKKYKKCCGK